MYQGKFSNKNASRRHDVNDDSFELEMDEPASDTSKQNSQYFSGEPEAQDPSLQFNIQFDQTDNACIPQQEQYEEEPSEEQPVTVVRRKWKGAIIGGIVFYLFLLAGISIFLFRMQGDMQVLTKQLTEYERQQPNYVSQYVFEQLFGNPNWAAIYDNAGIQVSQFEGKDAFVKFMEDRVGNTSLTYQKAAAKEENRNQYRVFLEKEEIGSFWLKNESEDPKVPQWQYDGVEIHFEADKTYRIKSSSDHIVKVNGVVLDDRNMIQKTGKIFTEDLGELSGGVSVPGVCLYEISDFLTQPQVTIEDSEGQQMEVSFDEESKLFSEPIAEAAVPEEESKLALDAVTTYCEYMIKKANQSTLSKFFKPGTDTFKAITGSDLTWIQKEKGHSTANAVVSDYVKLNGDAFSIRVSLTWQLVRKDDSVKESPVDVTLIFQKEDSGKIRCIRMTGKEFLEPFNTVRVRFMHENNVIAAIMVNGTDKTISCPTVGIPEGRKLAGWVTVMQDTEGNDYYQRVLEPDESGNARVPDGLFDNPVDLYPVHVKE